jgi:hypothetical protein
MVTLYNPRIFQFNIVYDSVLVVIVSVGIVDVGNLSIGKFRSGKLMCRLIYEEKRLYIHEVGGKG